MCWSLLILFFSSRQPINKLLHLIKLVFYAKRSSWYSREHGDLQEILWTMSYIHAKQAQWVSSRGAILRPWSVNSSQRTNQGQRLQLLRLWCILQVRTGRRMVLHLRKRGKENLTHFFTRACFVWTEGFYFIKRPRNRNQQRAHTIKLDGYLA